MDQNEQIIANFLRPPSEGGAYTDEKLAALLAHAEDGKLSYLSCCCVAGFPDARHAYQSGAEQAGTHGRLYYQIDERRYAISIAFQSLGSEDAQRRARIIPLIKSEMSRRESVRAQTEVSELVTV